MTGTRDVSSEIAANLDDLRAKSLAMVMVPIAIVANVWLVFVIWPTTGAGVGAAARIGAIALTTGVVASYFLRELHLRLASAMMVLALGAAVAGATAGYGAYDLAYLFAVPVIFASVLLGPVGTTVTSVVALTLMAGIGWLHLGLPPGSQRSTLSLAVVLVIALASYLSVHNLHVALQWVWAGFERARQNERLARAHSAELRQALKSLDEATHRLERLNHMLTIAHQQANEARRIKQQFAQTISHELRTPLSLIVGFTELIAQSPEFYGAPLPPRYMRDLGIVHRNARHLQSLVNDVLDLARIEAAQMSLVLEDADPGALVRDAVSTARSLVESKGLRLEVCIAEGLPRLRADVTRIRQVLFNLLNNAARFTDAGSVTVGARLQGNELVFAVADTGVGIAPEDVPRIFREFEQLGDSGRRRLGGVGLGLAISQGFVELHGGRIWVESVLGEGSAFSFALPLQGAEPVQVATIQRAAGAPMLPWRPVEEDILLAVTPSLSAAGLLTRYVRHVRTVVAHDLEQARLLQGELLPQAVVIDAAAFPMGEGELARLTKAWNLTGVPVLSCPLPGEEPARLQVSVDGYLIKPVSRDALWDVLRQFGEGIDRVLIVDDDRDFARLMEGLLDSPVRHYTTSSAYSGHEALEAARRWHPDIVLLDLRLPDMEGTEIVQQLRDDPAHADLPIILVSGQDVIGNVALDGVLSVTKSGGLLPSDVVQWIRRILDAVAEGAPPRR